MKKSSLSKRTAKKVLAAKPSARPLRTTKARRRAVIGLGKKAPALFVQGQSPEQRSDEQWVELFAYGISVSGFGARMRSGTEGRPVLILKDGREENALPVWLHPSALGQGEESHEFTRQLFEAMKIQVTHCQINEINGHRQYAAVFFDGHPTLKSLRVRADVAMTFCVAFKARFYSTRAFMMRCRDVDAEMMKLEQGLRNRPEFDSKTHPYVM